MTKNYKNAFKCATCPGSSDEDGCPAWQEIIMTNKQTGDQKIEKGCFYQVLPALVVESIKASNVATNTHAAIKNEIARGYQVLANALPGFVEALAENLENEHENKMLTPGDKN